MGVGSLFNKQEMNITKLYLTKVFRDEFKPIHTREMIVNASYQNTHHLSEALFYKGGLTITEKDLLAVPDFITLSDMPSDSPIMVNGGWGVDRYAFLMEITVYDRDSIKNLYLSGYTDRDDLFSLSGLINPDILLIFNDCLITQTVFNAGSVPFTRIINNWDILPNPEDDYRDTTLRPSDCFALIQGKEELSLYEDDISGISFQDTRLINRGGKVASKSVTSLDSHLVRVSNDYVNASVKALENSSKAEAISDAVWNGREQAAYTTIDLFNALWDATGEVITNHVTVGDLQKIAPMRFKDPASDYVVKEKDRRTLDSDIANLARQDGNFRALTTTDSESTSIISVETKLAQLLLQEINALMSVYKISKLAISATNYDKDYNNEPIVIISAADSIVQNTEINQMLIDSFEIAFKQKVFNKISQNDQLAISLVAYIGFQNEKVELSVNGQPPIVLAMPTYMSNAFSPLIGTLDSLKTLSNSYNGVFETLNSNITELRRAQGKEDSRIIKSY